jgi:hypothetical protein
MALLRHFVGFGPGNPSGGYTWLSYGKDVTCRLDKRRQGLQLSLGANGVLIGFKR